jgi:hypothetical protein
MLHQVDDAFTARHVRYRAVPRTNRTPATSSRAYQSKSARVERAGIVMQSSGNWSNIALWHLSGKRVYQALAACNHAEGFSFGDYEPELS